MSGGASVPFSIFAVYGDGTVAKTLLWISAFFCAWLSAYLIWSTERQKRRASNKQLFEAETKLNDRREEFEIRKAQVRVKT